MERMSINLSEVILTELADDSIEKILLNEESYVEEEIKQLMINEDIFLLRARRPILNPNFCEKVVPTYTEREFIEEFRIGKDVFQEICERFCHSDVYQNLFRGYGLTPTSAEKHLMTFLYYVGDESASFREVANRFDLCLQTVHAIITRVCIFLSNMSSQVITWPTSERKAEIIAHYRQNHHIPDIIGTLDATHILIDKPFSNHDDYVNGQGNHSVILQGISDHEHRFVDIFIGYQGSVSDGQVFVNSPVFKKLQDLCAGYSLVADEAYPSLKECLVPYTDSRFTTPARKHFNKVLRSCHVNIKQTLAMLKQRFRRLYHLKLRGHTRINHMTRACCVLHNLADMADVKYFAPPKEEDNLGTMFDLEDVVITGDERRDRIAKEIFRSN